MLVQNWTRQRNKYLHNSLIGSSKYGVNALITVCIYKHIIRRSEGKDVDFEIASASTDLLVLHKHPKNVVKAWIELNIHTSGSLNRLYFQNPIQQPTLFDV